MKLTAKKVRHKKKGESSGSIGKDMKISTRRVNQVWKEYKETGKEPVIGKELGRPKKIITSNESKIIKTAFDCFKFGARHFLNPYDFCVVVYALIEPFKA